MWAAHFAQHQKLRISAAAYASHYSSFGSNVDGRFGVLYDVNPSSVLRLSIGTGFRAPLMIERYVFPVDQLPMDQNCVALGQGNPNEKPEHATEYELGYSNRFANTAVLDASLYRTILRDPIENFYPLGARCPAKNPPLQSFPINAGNVVYEGAQARFVRRFKHLSVTAQYGLNVAYPRSLPAIVLIQLPVPTWVKINSSSAFLSRQHPSVWIGETAIGMRGSIRPCGARITSCTKDRS
ncbi:MAG: TonB-dependent receptor [Candidatus Eremiobacteraeota bacterium]|nr:TonB-dependent receptor [Candidatus Eremiobacteraeota bacterium]